MDKFRVTENRLNEAFKLAYFIHGDRETARCIALAAATKLDAAMAAQDKRSYYQAQSRNRVSLNEAQLLQRLVYIESEPFERIREQASSAKQGQVSSALDEESLLIHFVKHLVRITHRRTSFYVTLGMSRVLRNYGARETIEIYNTVIQDPELDRDESYYRARKGVLIKELKKRFGEMVSLHKGQRQETLFVVQSDSTGYAELVQACLNYFTPWLTTCVIPAEFNPIDHELTSLSMHHSSRDDVHQIEIARMHALFHPSCYQRLIEGLHQCYMNELQFDHPDQKLQIPHFNLAHNGSNDDGAPRSRKTSAELSESELIAMSRELAAGEARRKQWKSGFLRVVVDGVERARIDPKQTGEINFQLEDGEELVEIYGLSNGAETLLAAQLLTYDEDARAVLPPVFKIRLSRSQELVFILTPLMDSEGILSTAEVKISYRKIGLLRSALLWLSRPGNQESDNRRTDDPKIVTGSPGPFGWVVRYAIPTALVLTIFGASFLYLKVNRLQSLQSPAPAQTAQVNGPKTQIEAPNLPVVPLALTPSLTRGSGDIGTLILPSYPSQVAIRLKLTTAGYLRYRAAVFEVDDRAEVLARKITSEMTIDGEKWVVLTIPSTKLPIGDYQVKLSGAVNNGDFEEIGVYPFKVRDQRR